MAEQVRSGSAELTPRSLVETFTKQKSAREESCAQCTTRADFYALLDYTDHEQNDQYCTSCLDRLIEQGGPIVRSMVEIDWPSTAADDAIPVTKQELMSILSGGPAVVGRARRVVTLRDAPFVVVERHHGPGAHPGTGTPQEAHAEGGMVSPTTGARFVMATGEDQDARLLDWHPESQSLVWIRPEDYLQAVADDMGPAFGERDSRRSVIREEGIDRLKDRMRDGKPIDALWVDFELSSDQSSGEIVSQEGRHRAWAAIDLGVPYVPVITYFRPEGRGYWDLERDPINVREVHPWKEYLAGEADVERHMGPGEHPSGSPQDVHAGTAGVIPSVDQATPSARTLLSDEEIERFNERIPLLTDGPVDPYKINRFEEGWIGPDGSVYLNDDLSHEETARRAFERAVESPREQRISENLGPRAEILANALGWIRLSGTGRNAAVSFHAASPPTEDQISTMIQMVTVESRAQLNDFAFEAVNFGFQKNGDIRAEPEGVYGFGYGADKFYEYLDKVSPVTARVFKTLVSRHLGPGDHPSGSPQAVHAGKDGGGSIYEGWPEEEILEWEEKIADLQHEEAIFFSREGYEFRRTDLHPNGVRIPEFEQELIREENDAGRDTMLLHNHPSGWSFSFSDIEFALRNRIDEMIVVGNGSRYRMSINGDVPEHIIWGGTDPESGEQVEGALNLALTSYDETKFTIMPDSPSGELSQEDIAMVRTESLSSAWEAVETAYPEYFEYREESR